MEYYNKEHNERKRIVFGAIMTATLFLAVGFILIGSGVIKFNSTDLSMGYTYRDKESYSIGNGEFTTGSINEIDIDWVAGSVKIESYDGDRITISEPAGFSNSLQMRYKAENGKLTIKYMESGTMQMVNSLEKILVVQIPKHTKPFSLLKVNIISASLSLDDFTGDEVSINSVSGDIIFSDTTCNLLKTMSVSGRTEFFSTSTEDMQCESVSGSIFFIGNANRLSAKSVSGAIDIGSYTSPYSIKLESVSGRIAVRVPENKGFAVDIEKVSGNFSCEFPTIKQGDKYIYKDGGLGYRIKTISGNISIGSVGG